MHKIPHDALGRKRCGRCQMYKPLSAFGKDGSRWDGLNIHCRECCATKFDRYYQQNSEQDNRRCLEWRARNIEQWDAYCQERRATELGLREHFTAQEWANMKARYGNRCICCGVSETKRKKLSPDHVIPLSKGGSNHISNIQPLCFRCNLRKHTKTTDYRLLT